MPSNHRTGPEPQQSRRVRTPAPPALVPAGVRERPRCLGAHARAAAAGRRLYPRAANLQVKWPERAAAKGRLGLALFSGPFGRPAAKETDAHGFVLALAV